MGFGRQVQFFLGTASYSSRDVREVENVCYERELGSFCGMFSYSVSLQNIFLFSFLFSAPKM